MGHVTVICDNFGSAYKKAKEIKEIIKVKSYQHGRNWYNYGQ